MSSSTSEAEFQFWALTIPKNSEKKLEMENEKSVYHISNATLGNAVSQGRTTIYFNSKGKKAPICNLVDKTLENASLDLIISHSMDASFVTEGPNAVTVSGYVQPLLDESDSDMPTVFDMPVTNGADGAVEEKLDPDQNLKESNKRKFDESEGSNIAKASEKKRNKKKRKKEEKNRKANNEAPAEKKKTEKAKEDRVGNKLLAKSKQVVSDKSAREEDAKEATSKSKSSKKLKKIINAGKGVTYRVLKKGVKTGKPAKKGDTITLLYVGCLKDGTQFDKNLKTGLTFKIGGNEVIPGIELGVLGMRSKEKRRIIIPSEQGYGEDGASEGKIPPNAELTFTVQRK